MHINRRKFLAAAATAASIAAIDSKQLHAAAPGAGGRSRNTRGQPLIVSTWAFGKPANEEASRVLTGGGSILDAVEKGIELVENDPKNPSVGLGGMPNAAGVQQLDACIMLGVGHKAGSVAALEGIRHPIAVARRVMEKTPHVMLVGEGARMFALQEGLESVDMPIREKHEVWHREQMVKRGRPQTGPVDKRQHDTIAMLVLGPDGNLAGGCSTSGWGGKLPGRVGDSPIIGGGLYVDNEVGAAGATGLGENVMRYCATFLIVEFMRQGMHPEQACKEAILRISRQDPKGMDVSINFIALDKRGRFGAAGTSAGFEYSVWSPGNSRVLKGAAMSSKRIGPEGGNRR